MGNGSGHFDRDRSPLNTLFPESLTYYPSTKNCNFFTDQCRKIPGVLPQMPLAYGRSSLHSVHVRFGDNGHGNDDGGGGDGDGGLVKKYKIGLNCDQ